MALINSSKIFISIRRPHATCIINAQPKDTTTTTFFFFYHIHNFHQRISCTRSGPTSTCVCKWKWMSIAPQGGQRSAKMHSGTSLCRLHSRCVAPLSGCSPRECLRLGKHHLQLPSLPLSLSAASEGGCVTFPSLALACRYLPGACRRSVSHRGRTQAEHQMRLRGRVCRFSALWNIFQLRPLRIKISFHLRSESSEWKSQLFHFIPHPVISAHPTTCFL